MAIAALRNQLVKDLKSSWQKSALLGLLLLVGLYFWVPPLIRKITASSPVTAPVKTATSAKKPVEPAEPHVVASIDWQAAEEVFENDPLVRSAEVAAIESDPFQIDHDQFPPPVLFAPEPELPVDPPGQDVANHLPELELRSTIIGVSRKAAYINRRLYFEGSSIAAAGKEYTVVSIEPRRVTLQDDEQTYELRIPAAWVNQADPTQAPLNGPPPDPAQQ